MAKVLTAITVSVSAVLIRGQMSFLSNSGFDVAVCSSDGPEIREIQAREGFTYYPIHMCRNPSPLRDIIALWQILMMLKNVKPDIVNAGTPKAGFLFMVASYLLRIPIRVYHVRGFRHESLDGASSHVQVLIERISSYCATHIICLTPSVRELGQAMKIFPSKKCYVLGPGSSGVELNRFYPSRFSVGHGHRLRSSLGIPVQALVLGFVGRLVPRKGIVELVKVWLDIRYEYPSLYLVLVGPEEPAQPLPDFVSRIIHSDQRIISLGMVDDPAPYYAIMDIFTLPAHWEGFGNVLVEAAAMGKPVVSTTGTGTRDAVQNGFNGLLVPPKDCDALEIALRCYLDSSRLRVEHGNNGLAWARRFSRQTVLEHLRDFYFRALAKSRTSFGI